MFLRYFEAGRILTSYWEVVERTVDIIGLRRGLLGRQKLGQERRGGGRGHNRGRAGRDGGVS